MKNILVITSSYDETIDYFYKKYDAQLFRFDVNNFNRYNFSIVNDKWEIESSSWKISKIDVDSIYYRKPEIPSLVDYDKSDRLIIAGDMIAMVNGIVDDFYGTVLTKPSILRKAENKIYQLLLAKKCGFEMPMSYIGNDQKKCNSLIKKSKTIIKPIFLNKIQENECADRYKVFSTGYCDNYVDNIEMTPIYVQEYISKQYEVRLIILKNNCWTVKIVSKNRLDWRLDYDNNTYYVIEAPDDIKRKCMACLKKMDLQFGIFDFIVTNDDKWIFLEVNPNGQWLWLEEILGLDISEKIMEFLS